MVRVAIDIPADVIRTSYKSLGVDQIGHPAGEQGQRVNLLALHPRQLADHTIRIGQKREIEIHHLGPCLVVLRTVKRNPEDA